MVISAGSAEDFWSEVAARCLGKQPAVLRPPGGPIAAPDEIFAAVAALADGMREAPAERAPILFFLDGGARYADLDELLPRPSDRTCEAYAERIAAHGREFLVMANGVHLHDEAVWTRARRFLSGLFRVTGHPVGTTFLHAFFGAYRHTPFGAHVDRHDVFAFVVGGVKTVHVWPPGFFPMRGGHTRYRSHLDRAVTLRGEPGDVLYWPAGHWHVAESDGALTLSLSLAVLDARTPARFLVEGLEEALADREEPRRAVPLPAPSEPTPLPEETRRALDDTLPDLRRACAARWLNQLTAFGFASVPGPSPVAPLAEDDVVEVEPCFPIRWHDVDGALICSANGSSLEIPFHPRLVDLLARLNAGAPLRVREILDRAAAPDPAGGALLDRGAAQAVLDELHRLRAFRLRSRG
jgi:hypothetical protein